MRQRSIAPSPLLRTTPPQRTAIRQGATRSRSKSGSPIRRDSTLDPPRSSSIERGLSRPSSPSSRMESVRTHAASPRSLDLEPRSATRCVSWLVGATPGARPTPSPRSSRAAPRCDVARLDRDAILSAITDSLKATPDPEGLADVVAAQGHLNVAATDADTGTATKPHAPHTGYRSALVYPGDLITASSDADGMTSWS